MPYDGSSHTQRRYSGISVHLMGALSCWADAPHRIRPPVVELLSTSPER